MAGPITPDLGKHFSLQVGAKFGSLTSAYPFGMLLGLFLWPSLSDRIGRKPVMTVSLLGSGLGLAAQSYAIQSHWSLRYFLITRILTGSFAGSSPVSKAYLADVGSAQGKLPQYLALRDAASTMAFIVGPMLGGLLFDLRKRILGNVTFSVSESLAFVIGITSAASLAAAALVALFVKEIPPVSRKKEKQQQDDDNSNNDLVESITSADGENIISCPLGVRLWAGVATVCVVSFLFNVGDSTFHAFFPSILRQKLSLDTQTIGLSYTVFACLSFLVSATLAGRSVQNLGPVKTCSMGLTAVGTGLIALSMAASPALVFAAAALYYCGVPFYGPTVPAMLLRCVPSHRRGTVMGLDGAINTIGRVIAPLVMGELYRRRGPTAAFGVAGVAVLSAAILALIRRFMVVQQRHE